MIAPDISERGVVPVSPPADRAPYPPGYRQSWALIVGINYQKHPKLNPLDNAEEDAKAIRDLLRDVYGFPKENIIALIGVEATRDNILNALDGTLADTNNVDPNDRVLVFFAGHGMVRATSDPDKNKPLGYLVPYDDDGTWPKRIKMSELRDFWNTTPAKHVLCIIDTCYSGLANVDRGEDELRAFDNSMLRYKARHIITAGTSEQKIHDGFQINDGSDSKHSYLTYYLLDALQNGIPYQDLITADNLHIYLRNTIFTMSNGQQMPTFGNYGHESGLFLLSRPGISLPREIWDGLHGNEPAYVINAIVQLRQLFTSVQNAEKRAVDETDSVENWREVITPELLQLLGNHVDPKVLEEASQLLIEVLRESKVLQTNAGPAIVQLLYSDESIRMQQAAVILAALASGDRDIRDSSNLGDKDRTLSSIEQLVLENDRIRTRLESGLVQDNPVLALSALRALVKLFPSTTLLWLRLMLINAEAADDIHFLVFQYLKELGDNIDILLLRQAIDRRPINSGYHSRAADCILTLLLRLNENHVLNEVGRKAAMDALEQTAQFDTSLVVRLEAMKAVTDLNSQKSSEILSAALMDSNWEIRRQALQLLNNQFALDINNDLLLSKMIDILINEPIPDLRVMACNCLGQFWCSYNNLSYKMDVVQKKDVDRRIERIANLLGKVLGDSNSLEDSNSEKMRIAAAKALGFSGSPVAASVVNGYIDRFLQFRQKFKRVLDELKQEEEEKKQATAMILKVVPISAQLIEAFVLLVSYTDNKEWSLIAPKIQQMLHIAQEFGEPELLPLIEHWLQRQPKHYTDNEGTDEGALHLQAIGALGLMPRERAIGPARDLLKRALDDEQTQIPALYKLAESLAELGGPDSFGLLVDMLDAHTSDVRAVAALRLNRINLPSYEKIREDVPKKLVQRFEEEVDDTIKQRLQPIMQRLMPAPAQPLATTAPPPPAPA